MKICEQNIHDLKLKRRMNENFRSTCTKGIRRRKKSRHAQIFQDANACRANSNDTPSRPFCFTNRTHGFLTYLESFFMHPVIRNFFAFHWSKSSDAYVQSQKTDSDSS